MHARVPWLVETLCLLEGCISLGGQVEVFLRSRELIMESVTPSVIAVIKKVTGKETVWRHGIGKM